MLTNHFLPLREGERRIGKDTAEVLFTKSYVATMNGDGKQGIDFNKVSTDLSDPEIIRRAKRVENVSRPASAVLFATFLGAAAIVGMNTIKNFPEGTYELGPLTVRTGEDAEKQPPLCTSVEDTYLQQGYSMQLIGAVDELETSFPIDDSCIRSGDVYGFSLAD